jgi:nucleoside-diphosphate-sugar epimerase
MEKILVIGAGGQLGGELVDSLAKKYGNSRIIASDIKNPGEIHFNVEYRKLNALDFDGLKKIVNQEGITQIYHLAAVLSAKAEQNPLSSWDINMKSLLNVLELAREKSVKVFWPSSIAVFGPDTPKENTPQFTLMNPNTIYGISKLAGERWCEYYFNKYGVDVRSVRYPGLIGYKTLPGGGTTDYAVDIYIKAIQNVDFECFLSENSMLPMMYMDDAVRGTIELMETPSDQISVRSSYNMAAMSFSPKEIYNEIKKQFPDFEIVYNPDFRQKIADSWPGSIDDSVAREDLKWHPSYNLEQMSQDIIAHLKVLLSKETA